MVFPEEVFLESKMLRNEGSQRIRITEIQLLQLKIRHPLPDKNNKERALKGPFVILAKVHL
jgi:hypothetical protein